MRGRVVFLSNHVYQSRRRAGFHELAGAFAKGGWHVSFITTGISYLSIVRGDRRLQSLTRKDFNTTTIMPDGVHSHVWMPLVHPVRTHRLAERFEDIAFGHYGNRLSDAVAEMVREADIIVFESNPSLLLFDSVKKIAPKAKMVYRISDDVRIIKMSDIVRKKEDDIINQFDLLSIPSKIMLENRFDTHRNARIHPHGIADMLIGSTLKDPFTSHVLPKAVSIGSTLFDHEFLKISADVRPDIEIHIVGDISSDNIIDRTNVIFHGEIPFIDAASFSSHTDIAIAAYKFHNGGEYLAETSNKIIQYTYFRKPIIAPRVIHSKLGYPHIVPYDVGDPISISRAYDQAMALDTASFDLPRPLRWTEVRDMILRDIG